MESLQSDGELIPSLYCVSNSISWSFIFILQLCFTSFRYIWMTKWTSNRQNASAQEESLRVVMPRLFSFKAYTILAERMSSANGKKRKLKPPCNQRQKCFSLQRNSLLYQGNPQQMIAPHCISLCEYGRFTGVWWSLCLEPEPVTLQIQSIEEIIYCEEFLQAQGLQNQLAFLMEKCKIDDTLVEDIASLTICQHDKPLWHRIRRRGLTASNFGVVLHAKRVTTSLIKRLMGK